MSQCESFSHRHLSFTKWHLTQSLCDVIILALHISCSPSSVIKLVSDADSRAPSLLHRWRRRIKGLLLGAGLLPLNYTHCGLTSAKTDLMRRCQSEREQQLLPRNSGSGKGSGVYPVFTVTELAQLHRLHCSENNHPVTYHSFYLKRPNINPQWAKDKSPEQTQIHGHIWHSVRDWERETKERDREMITSCSSTVTKLLNDSVPVCETKLWSAISELDGWWQQGSSIFVD